MSNTADQPPRKQGPIGYILVTLAVVGAIWLLFAMGSVPSSEEAASAPAASDSQQPWPTVPPTFTPVATRPAVLVPTPTPISLPPPQVVSDLTVIKYTLASTQTAGGSDAAKLMQLFGKDEATLRVVGRVHVGIPLDQIERDVSLQSDGRTITVRLPELRVITVEILPEQTTLLESSQRWLLSDYPGLELQAMQKGYNDLYNQVASSPEMMKLAEDVARLKVADHLRSLGFTDITVTVAP